MTNTARARSAAYAAPTSVGVRGGGLADFVSGSAVVFDDDGQTAVLFSQDVWYPLDRLPKDGRKSDARVNFAALPEWLRDAAKRYVAHLWLERLHSAKQMQAFVAAARLLAAVGAGQEPPFEGPISALTRHHGDAVGASLLRRAQAAIDVMADAKGVPRRARLSRLRAANALTPDKALKTAEYLNQFAAWLRREPQSVPTDLEVRLPNEVRRDRERQVLGADVEKVIPDDVLGALLGACDRELALYRELDAGLADVKAGALARVRADSASGKGTPGYLVLMSSAIQRHRAAWRNAILAQAVKLCLVAGRRRAAIATLPLQPSIAWDALNPLDPATRTLPTEQVAAREGEFDEGRFITIRFTAYKQYGDEGLPDDVQFPGFLGDQALAAIRTAQELTAPLRAKAAPSDRERLFIVPPSRRGVAEAVTGGMLQTYLTRTPSIDRVTGKTKLPGGLVQRYGISGAESISTHNPRTTMATAIVEAGGSVSTAARYLAHLPTRDKNNLMAKLFYVAGGTPENRRRMEEFLKRGMASGPLFNGYARLATQHAGGAAAEAAVPPNELTYEQALQRIRKANIVTDEAPTTEQVLALLEDGRVISWTPYGGCLLQRTTGPCPTAELCPVGIYPESAETQAGDGCPYQVLTPDAVDRLREDVAGMERKIAYYQGRPEFYFWLRHEERLLTIWQRQIARAEALQRLTPDRGAEEGCGDAA